MSKVLTKKDIASRVAVECGMLKGEMETVVNVVFDKIAEALAEGDTLKVIGFGTFDVVERKGQVKDMKTGGTIDYCTKGARFKQSGKLKEILNYTE